MESISDLWCFPIIDIIWWIYILIDIFLKYPFFLYFSWSRIQNFDGSCFFVYIKRFVDLLILPSKPYWNSFSIKRIKRGIRTTFKLLHQREIFVYGHVFFVMLYAINYIFGKEKKLDVFFMLDNFCKINNL